MALQPSIGIRETWLPPIAIILYNLTQYPSQAESTLGSVRTGIKTDLETRSSQFGFITRKQDRYICRLIRLTESEFIGEKAQIESVAL